MISCVITTLKVNVYQRKSDLLRINFIISRQPKNQIMRQRVPGLQNAYYSIMWLFLSMHVMKVAGISPFNHLKCMSASVNIWIWSFQCIYPMFLHPVVMYFIDSVSIITLQEFHFLIFMIKLNEKNEFRHNSSRFV